MDICETQENANQIAWGNSVLVYGSVTTDYGSVEGWLHGSRLIPKRLYRQYQSVSDMMLAVRYSRYLIRCLVECRFAFEIINV